MEPATPAQIAAMRRRYLVMATLVVYLDLAIVVMFNVAADAADNIWRSALGTLAMLVVLFFAARWLFEPVRLFLEGKASFESAQRRLTQLPLLTARLLLPLGLLAVAYRTLIPFWIPEAMGQLRATPADAIATALVLAIFYFTFTYFVVSDYLARLCDFIFRHYARNLELFFGRYSQKLSVALLVISIAPLIAILVDLFSYTDVERLRDEILVDGASALLGVAIAAFFITRSLMRPLRVLSTGMNKVAEGNLDVRLPVTSNDEVGEVTGRFNNMVEGLRERERIRETFGRYVDESVAAAILKGDGNGALAGETGEATILFTDIEGFTSIAEVLPPHRMVAALNEYLETVLAPIKAHGGVVNTFIGDGLFASFNMPLACEGHAVAAVRAAIDIQRAVGARTFGPDGIALATRIGINTGRVIGGSVGAGERMSFTLLGDAVNLAARLEQLNKDHGTRILVSDSTREACGESFVFRSLGEVPVRGRSELAAVYAIDTQDRK
jgi:class 3 adenylate cyclase